MLDRNKPKPIALICGMLEDNGRVLHLVRIEEKDQGNKKQKIEKIELPGAFSYSKMDPIIQLTEAFSLQTGIDGEVHEIVFETRYNIGSKRKKVWIPC
ncbi:hypothetical protein HZC07_04740, partial [Candidatus Micrarchaeota archaeon]|nr:hypothetical protein [Candidatus Micrarchaeota archaeon]